MYVYVYVHATFTACSRLKLKFYQLNHKLYIYIHLCVHTHKCQTIFVRYLRGRIKAGTHGLSAVERAYGRLWSMADRTWQIQVSLEVTSVTTYRTRHLYFVYDPAEQLVHVVLLSTAANCPRGHSGQ